jgi:hypothetical protein
MIDGETSCMPTGVKVRKTLKGHPNPNVQIKTAGGSVGHTFLLDIKGSVQSQNGFKLDRLNLRHEPLLLHVHRNISYFNKEVS